MSGDSWFYKTPKKIKSAKAEHHLVLREKDHLHRAWHSDGIGSLAFGEINDNAKRLEVFWGSLVLLSQPKLSITRFSERKAIFIVLRAMHSGG